jgi:hypothetical protein
MCTRRDRNCVVRVRRLCTCAWLCPAAMPLGLWVARCPSVSEWHCGPLPGPGLGAPSRLHGPPARPSLSSARCCLGACVRSCCVRPSGRFLFASPEGHASSFSALCSACEGEAVACHVSNTLNCLHPWPLARRVKVKPWRATCQTPRTACRSRPGGPSTYTGYLLGAPSTPPRQVVALRLLGLVVNPRLGTVHSFSGGATVCNRHVQRPRLRAALLSDAVPVTATSMRLFRVWPSVCYPMLIPADLIYYITACVYG